jgi:hydroxypyruvate isomerase
MMRLSTCLEWLYTETGDDIGDRVRAAADDGTDAVEIWSWRTKDLDSLGSALAETGSQLVSMIVDPQCRLVDPATHEEFVAAVADSVVVARRLGVPYLVAVAGQVRDDVPRAIQHAALVEALRGAADVVEGTDVTVLLEPLNSRVDHVGTYLDRTSEGLEAIREVGSPRVRLLYDAYHSIVMGEDPRTELAGAIDLVGHVQIADAPGRQEPGTGDVDWAALLGTLADLGYTGGVGLECRPSVSTSQAMAYIRKAASQVDRSPR